MQNKRRKLQIYLSIALLIGAALYYFESPLQSITPQQQAKVTDSKIDFFVSDAKFRRFDQQGKLSQTLDADTLEHDRYRGVTLFEQPVMSDYLNSQNYNTIRSRNASAEDNKGPITFRDNVLVEQKAQDQVATELRSATLRYDRKNEQISTKDPVEIVRANGSTVNAVGLHADLTLKRITLENNVKGIIYEN
ncbi:MAG: LPS export ABC transporter periplasmic protein LptC [Pseudomonadales bacterium]